MMCGVPAGSEARGPVCLRINWGAPELQRFLHVQDLACTARAMEGTRGHVRGLGDTLGHPLRSILRRRVQKPRARLCRRVCGCRSTGSVFLADPLGLCHSRLRPARGVRTKLILQEPRVGVSVQPKLRLLRIFSLRLLLFSLPRSALPFIVPVGYLWPSFGNLGLISAGLWGWVLSLPFLPTTFPVVQICLSLPAPFPPDWRWI